MENDKAINEESQPDQKKHTGGPDLNSKDAILRIISLLKQKLKSQEKLFRVLHLFLIIIISVLIAIFIFSFIFFSVPALKELPSGKKAPIANNKELKKNPAYIKQIGLMSRDIQRLSRKYYAYTSGQSYIVINTTDNRFFLYRNKKLLREGFCSTGSLTMLKTEKGDRVWVFKTPKGKHWIQGKTTNPSWKRPDWSFIEEGLPVPPKDDPSRYEYGVLGDYAMSIGDGYLIHGTIYKRFLGMPVTHGCVRLNDEDLEVIFNTLSIGSKVYIF
jgi:lipoprotein-anchoring transpeptidase ErfK/SrfK